MLGVTEPAKQLLYICFEQANSYLFDQQVCEGGDYN
jgi:hypothetical protein